MNDLIEFFSKSQNNYRTACDFALLTVILFTCTDMHWPVFTSMLIGYGFLIRAIDLSEKEMANTPK